MNPLDKGLLLHVGLPKTGTTTLQRSLFAGHSQVTYVGKFMHGDVEKGCLNADVYQALKPALWGPSLSRDIQRARRIYHEKVFPGLSTDKYLIGSWEGLGSRPALEFVEMLRILRHVLDSCRIMITVRNPLRQVPSEYLQDVHGHFVKNTRRWMGLSPYIEIEEWFARKLKFRGKANDVLNYAENIKASIEVLGSDNVGIFLFEDLDDNPDAYYRSISEFIGIDHDESLVLVEDKHFHKRISQEQLDWLKETSMSGWGKYSWRIKSTKTRKQLFDKNGHGGAPARVVVPEPLKKKIENLTREGNRWLAVNCGLPLQHYGYPL